MRPRHALMRIAAVALVGLALLAAGCGVGNDARPRDIGPNEQPFPLAPTSLASPTTAPTNGQKIYLISTDGLHLAASARDADSRDNLIRSLLIGLTQKENDLGLKTFIPIGTTLAGTSISKNGILTVRLTLPADPTGLEGQNAAKAFGQLVYTATNSPDVKGVLFTVNDQEVHPFDANGKPILRPATRQDYSLLAPVSGFGPDVKTPGGVATTTTVK